MGIPQGSILGRILFLIFINGFPSCINRCQCNTFADDAILYTQSTLKEVQCELQTDFNNVIKWFNSNRLHVNNSKSSCMVMNTHGNALDLNIHIDGTPLDNVNSTKYLGVLLTSTLSWHDHISGACSMLGRVIRKLRGILYTNELIIVYKTLIQPHILWYYHIWLCS